MNNGGNRNPECHDGHEERANDRAHEKQDSLLVAPFSPVSHLVSSIIGT